MKQKFFNVVILAICLIFAGTLIGTGYVLYQDYKVGQESAQEKLDKLYRQTEEAISYFQYPNSDFIKSFTRAVGSPDYYYSIRLETPSQEIYVFPSEKTKKRGLTVTDSRRITEGNTVDMTLTVQIYTLPLNLVFSRAKIAFIIILSGTFVSALFLLYLYLNGTSKAERLEEDDFNFDENEISDEPSEIINDQIETTSETVAATSNSSSDKTIVKESESFDSDIDVETNLFEQTEKQIPEVPPAVKPAVEHYSAGITAATENNNDKPADTISSETPEHEDLFSSTTGFCCEKYLVPRLESELARAASGEIDISLILIQITDFDFNCQCGIEICKQLIDIFHYKDMLFEYQKDGIAIIYSNADIDKAMESGEAIYAELCASLSKYNIAQKPYIGIASRSLRFISGERLITEAQQALFHAKEDPESPIIAFRVNPEKYRKFMAEKK